MKKGQKRNGYGMQLMRLCEQIRNGYRTDRERDGDSGYVEWRTDT